MKTIRVYCRGNLCAVTYIVGTGKGRCTCCGGMVWVALPW